MTNKKIILGIIALIILVSGYIFYQSKKNTAPISYYQKLAQECEQKTSKNCCLASVKRMEETGSHRISSEGVCDEGYKKEMMMCIDSLVWCEKSNMDDMDEILINKKTISTSQNIPIKQPVLEVSNKINIDKPAHTDNKNINKEKPVKKQIRDNKENTSGNARLLFKSGFEDGVYIDNNLIEDAEDYRIIRGSDVSPFSWPINIFGAKESGLHYVLDDNQKAVFSKIKTTMGHDGKLTRALYQQENYQLNNDDTQCPYEILDIKDGAKDLYIRYWIKLDSESITKKQNDLWRTFFEYKTKDYAKGTGFRLISFVDTDDDGVPYWHWQGDRNSESSIWEIKNKKIPVPLDEWFLTEFYWHWSNGKDGQALWKVNNQVIGNHFGPTTRNSKPIDFIMLFQIYGTSNPKHQWVDDIEIWDTFPEKYKTESL